jgi:hypothetical protein
MRPATDRRGRLGIRVNANREVRAVGPCASMLLEDHEWMVEDTLTGPSGFGECPKLGDGRIDVGSPLLVRQVPQVREQFVRDGVGEPVRRHIGSRCGEAFVHELESELAAYGADGHRLLAALGAEPVAQALEDRRHVVAGRKGQPADRYRTTTGSEHTPRLLQTCPEICDMVQNPHVHQRVHRGIPKSERTRVSDVHPPRQPRPGVDEHLSRDITSHDFSARPREAFGHDPGARTDVADNPIG